MEADQRLVPCTVSALVLSLCPQSGLVGIGIAESIDEPRLYTHENLPQGPTWEEVKKLLTGVTGASLLQVRGRCVILLCAVYGFRVGEVCRLRLADIDWAEERISVHRPKQRRVQTYPLITEGETRFCAICGMSGPTVRTGKSS